MNPDIFESDDVAKSCPVSYRTINQYGGTTSRPSFSIVNLDTIGCVWTGEFDLNTLRVDGEIFESGKKKLRIQKYPDTCGRGVSVDANTRATLIYVIDYSRYRHTNKSHSSSIESKDPPKGHGRSLPTPTLVSLRHF